MNFKAQHDTAAAAWTRAWLGPSPSQSLTALLVAVNTCAYIGTILQFDLAVTVVW